MASNPGTGAGSASLVSSQHRVETPFIIVKIGNYTFGNCSDMSKGQRLSSSMKVTYPNFMDSLSITKVNGSLNTYSIRMVYAITELDDPNLIEKILSSVSNQREVTLTYGDWNTPGYIYKEEVALITKVTSNVDFANSRITYQISCISSALALKAGVFSFNSRFAKPSDVIKELLANQAYGLTTIFSGMRNATKNALNNFLIGDDKAVKIDAKPSTNVLDYISYLVSCMVSQTDKGGGTKDSQYMWSVFDDVSNEYGGAYFKITKVSTTSNYNASYNTYEVDVGYPSGNFVSAFSVDTNDTWSILYDHSTDVQLPQYAYSIDNHGELVSNYSPAATRSSKFLSTTESDRSWWTQMTQFPITAKLTIRGLLRPTILMSFVTVNTYFYGHKHISSGIYIITKQEDTIDGSGYRTTLTLTRLKGD